MLIADLTITNASGYRVPLPTHRASNITVHNTKHGFGSISFNLPLTPAQLVLLYGNPLVLDVSLKHAGALFNGRLEDIQIKGDHVQFTALGYWRALSDLKYTAMWSVTDLKAFQAEWLANTTQGPTTNRFFTIDSNNGTITIGLVKNTIMALNTRAHMYYRIPDQSNRQINGVMIDYALLTSANVTMRISLWNSAYPFGGFGSNAISLAGNGALQIGSTFTGVTACDVISFGLEVTTLHNYNGETGAEYVKITGIRIVTDNSFGVNVSLTAVRTNGSPVTCTVGSTANMYIGMRLILSGGGKSESVIVLTIPSSTTFTANVVNAPGGGYPIGTNVASFEIYPNQVVSGLINYVANNNPTQLNSNTGLVQTAAYDMLDETYIDALPSEIIDYLSTVGDGVNQFETGVLESKLLYFRTRNSVARTWYINYEDPDVRTSLDALHNSYYATYNGPNNTALRTTTSTDSVSASKYGVIRQSVIDVRTTNVTLANKHRDLAITNNKTILPQANVVVSKVWYNAGTIGRLEDVRSGDYIVVMNIPPVVVGTTLDLLRTFRVVETALDFDNAMLTIVPEVLLPSIVRQVSTLLTK